MNEASCSHSPAVHHHGRDAGLRRARLWSAYQAHRDRTHERRELQHAPPFLVEPGLRRRSLRVPDRGRRGVHELGARVRPGRLHHQEHDGDRRKDAAQRHVLLAGARAELDRQLAVRVVGHAVVHDGLVVDALAHLADERRGAGLSAAAAAELVGRRRRTEVPADGRHRPRAGVGAERLPGRHVGDVVLAVRPACQRHLLLGRAADRCRGPRGRPVADLALHLELADGHEPERDRSRSQLAGL